MIKRHHNRLIPIATGILGGFIAVPLVGVYGSVFGFALGFLLGAVALSMHHVTRARGSAEREREMHADAMSHLRAMGSLGPMRIAAPPARRTPVSLRRAIEAIDLRASTDLEGALRDAEQLAREYPGSAVLLGRLANLQLAAEQEEEALLSARDAIDAAFALGATPVAVGVWDDFSDRASDLPLEPVTRLHLGEALVHLGRWSDALPCLEAASEAGLDTELLEERVHEGIAALERSARRTS